MRKFQDTAVRGFDMIPCPDLTRSLRAGAAIPSPGLSSNQMVGWGSGVDMGKTRGRKRNENEGWEEEDQNQTDQP